MGEVSTEAAKQVVIQEQTQSFRKPAKGEKFIILITIVCCVLTLICELLTIDFVTLVRMVFPIRLVFYVIAGKTFAQMTSRSAVGYMLFVIMCVTSLAFPVFSPAHNGNGDPVAFLSPYINEGLSMALYIINIVISILLIVYCSVRNRRLHPEIKSQAQAEGRGRLLLLTYILAGLEVITTLLQSFSGAASIFLWFPCILLLIIAGNWFANLYSKTRQGYILFYSMCSANFLVWLMNLVVGSGAQTSSLVVVEFICMVAAIVLSIVLCEYVSKRKKIETSPDSTNM